MAARGQEMGLVAGMDDGSDRQQAKSQWYVAHCKRLKERQAAAALEEQLDLMVYLPEVRRRLAGHGQRVAFFPGYLFVRANLWDVALSQINAIPGVLRLVAFGEAPQPLPAKVVEEIRRRVDDLNAHGGLMPPRFQRGDTLRLTGGPFQGLDAVFLGPLKPSERVQVLIEFLGSLRKLELPVDQVERAHDQPAPRRERRTRGKGRPIRPNTKIEPQNR
jgi:transcriptional antiterminator RfaH